MQIVDPARLLSLRQRKRLSRPQLAERSKVNERTIQRLEKEPQPSRKNTLKRLATALGVKPGVLTGEEPLPESGNAPTSAFKPPQIGAQITPKVRLAYDLIKRRYGVGATEIINMAPLFFTLLAEGSLAWRREKIEEVKELKSRVEQIDGFWRGGALGMVGDGLHDEGLAGEDDSIQKADLFGEYLLSTPIYDFFDPSTDNPFASYLRRLKAELDITGVVDVDSDDLMFGSPLKFPDYDICRDELDGIANGSRYAKMALETGDARISEIPEKLMTEDASEERVNWLGDRLPDLLKDQIKIIKALEKRMKELEKEIKERGDRVKEMVRSETYPEGVSEKEYLMEVGEVWKEEKECREELGHLEEKHREELSRLEMIITEEKGRSNSNTEKGGDDQ